MRLGDYSCELAEGSIARESYGKSVIHERHRHRYKFNNAYTQAFEQSGMHISGRNPGRNLAEIVELADHPFFVAVQFHPEFISRPDRPHPLFTAFVAASKKHAAVLAPE